MKHELSTIYRELSAGKLSQAEALKRIKALKQAGDGAPGTLLAAPAWDCTDAPAPMEEGAAYSQHRVLLCDLPGRTGREIESRIPGSRCADLQTQRSGSVGDRYAEVALAFFDTLRGLLQDKPEGPCLVQLVVADNDHPILAGLAGLLESAALENPDLIGQIIFVHSDISVDDLVQCICAERGSTERLPERAVRYNGRERLCWRWQFIEDVPASGGGECIYKEHGVYLITGGLGGLGLLFAREILEKTSRAKVVLSGRGAPAGDKRAILDSLRDSGRVEYRQMDVTDAGEVDRLVEAVVADYGRLDGIIHSAGVLRDEFILRKRADQFTDVLAPKVAGTEHLDSASRALALDFFLLFSSIASWAGNIGQADYAAANGFMERFADYRNTLVSAGERRGKTLAIGWPHWLDGGMNVDAASLVRLEKRTGLRSMSTDAGMEALQRSLALPRGHVMVMHGEPAEMRRALESRPATSPVSAPAINAAVATPAEAGNLGDKTREFLRKEFSGILKVPLHRIESTAPLENYGIDSILAMDLTSQLESTFGTLPKTLFFEYQTIGELADYLARSHGETLAGLFASAGEKPQAAEPDMQGTQAPEPPVPPRPNSRRRRQQRFLAGGEQPKAQSSANEPIAIIGLSGRYPGSPDLDVFWRNLRDGRDCITEVPRERWDWREYYSEDRTKEGVHLSKWGGFIDGVDEFDPRFFNISPREARTIDPQERLLLQHAWAAIEDAGYTRASLQIPEDKGLAGQVGVYAGVMYGEYNLSGTLASIANRVSYFLNLHGPSLTLDTMCSSSLTAIHLACQDLRLGRTQLGIAGGVNVSIHPNKYTLLSGGQFISSDGRCQSFGEGGDGYIPGEGVGVAILKRLPDAERDGNHIYGVIRGSALNHGGKTNGYTVPNPQAQAEVIRRAMAEAGIEPRQVSYIEAHGTGTKLGDPIEITALTRAFHESGEPSAREVGYCRIGSAKSNIGHCESAAGIAGVSKVLLQMNHGVLVPSLHSQTLNPHIDFESTPFVVNQALSPWEPSAPDGRQLPRIAGISSFGAGGSNAHVLIEEYRAAEKPVASLSGPVILPLSARTEAQLEQRARDLLAFIERSEQPVDLRSMAYTLQVGREAMEERAAFLASSIEEVAEQLTALLNGDGRTGEIHRAQVKKHRESLSLFTADPDFQNTIDCWIADRKMPKLAELWVKGLDVDWRRLLDADHTPRLMSLPTYPFARERYWVEPAVVATPETGQSAQALHPLVHTNTSNLQQLGYVSRFAGTEPFLEDDGAGQKFLPPLLALEMIYAAAALAPPQEEESGHWELRQTHWGKSFQISADRRIELAVLPQGDGTLEVEIYSEAGDGEEAIHCQSRALFSQLPAPGRIDLGRIGTAMADRPVASPSGIERLLLGDGEALAEVRLPVPTAYLIHPQLLDILAQLTNRVTKQTSSPVCLERLRIVFAPPERTVVWLRGANSGVIDIDLCDEQGNVCVQMEGLSLEAAGPSAATTPAETITSPESAPQPVDSPASARLTDEPGLPAPREIVLASAVSSAAVSAAGPASPKPTAVRLQSSGEVSSAEVTAKPKVTLGPLSGGSVVAPSGDAGEVRLFDLGRGVFSIELHATSLDAVIEPLVRALDRVRDEELLKALLLCSRQGDAWRGNRESCNAAIEHRLFETLATFPCPVIAAVPGDIAGAGLLLAAVCDFMVCSEDGEYSFTDSDAGLFPSPAEEDFFRERLGAFLADDLLYGSIKCSGRKLQQKGWACRVAPATRVKDDAKQLAVALAEKPQPALGLLKAHLSRDLVPLVAELTSVEVLETVPACTEAEGKVLLLRLGEDRDDCDVPALLAELDQAFERVAGADDYRSVVLTSALDGFLPASGIDAAMMAGLRDRVRACPVPVIAAFESGAKGPAWLFALFCDQAVYAAEGRYCASALWADPALEPEVSALCARRLGTSLGQEVCLTGDSYSGTELRERLGTSVVVHSGEVEAAAMRLAAFWAAWPRATVATWKRAQSDILQRLVDTMPKGPALQIYGEVPLEKADDQKSPAPIELRSSVVSATARADGVVVVEMRDRDARNMFSEALVAGLKEAFDHIDKHPAYRAVVLTGYDNYFATGGTVETLLAIQEGRAQFTDETVFQRPMECPIPVIAAIQGHGIGGGWSFGMFSDLILLSRESRYLSPYMGYGFTPGAGSTLMFPARIGLDLARETLMTAQEVSGLDLQERGLALPVLPRVEVLPAAIELAARVARQPRERLVALKRTWTHALRQSREEVYRRELEMHGQTFVRNADTLKNIQGKFTDESAPVRAQKQAAVPAPAESGSVVDKLRSMLAQELFLEPGEIDGDTSFIDLGLDSITGVTWIRKINEHYGTDIEATKVYSHPTLEQLGRLVANEAAIEAAPEPTVPASQAAGKPAQATPPAAASLSAPAVDSPAGEGRGSVVARLKIMLAAELHLDPEEIGETQPFIDMGLDSITGVTWVRKINEHYGTAIEATKVYSHPTLREIAELVRRESGTADTASAPAAERPAPRPVTAHLSQASAATERPALASLRREGCTPHLLPAGQSATGSQPIAVIGIAGQFPRARNLEEFWSNLAEGRNCVGEVTDGRWKLADYYQAGAPKPGKTNSKWLGALDDFDRFDPLFFNISPTEAECMDPQQRLFLQSCYHSIENAGYAPQSLSGTQCGVFVGCGPSDYHQASSAHRLSAQGFTGAATSVLAARVSYFLNLRGPCFAVDTACSSSLVAIANACDSLNAGHSDLALAGGVYVMAGPSMHIMTAQAGMLSADGRCFTFDQRANGFVPGEGVGVLMLKRLADAERDKDHIRGVIEGWGINQDGRSNGITAPNDEAQTRLLQSVYRRFDIDPAGIQLIEAHGTGTKLGDPIEVAGLKAAFKPFTDKVGYCALGSVKSNIGHCLTAAGAAGILKLILALKHRALPPTINYERRNEHIQLEGSPFRINDSIAPWDVASGDRRRSAISSFGFGGTNAHLVVAEHRPAMQTRAEVSVVTQDSKIMVPLSARTETQLRQKAEDLLTHIRDSRTPPDLRELAYTLQVGRDPMGERLGLLVDSVDTLADKLKAFAAGQSEIPDLYRGQVSRHKEGMKLISQDDEMRTTIVEKYLGQRNLAKLLDLWVKGLDLDWSLLYGDIKPQRIELPNYPFARDSYWIAAPGGGRETAVPAPTATQPVELPLPARDPLTFLPQWVHQPLPAGAEPAAHKSVLIVRTAACFGLEKTIRSHCEAAASQVTFIDLGEETRPLEKGEWSCGVEDPDGFRRCLEETDSIDALYFLSGGELPPFSPQAEGGPDGNEIQLLRLVKSLKESGRIDRRIDTYLLTIDSHPSAGCPGRYRGAGVSGLGYSLAQGNHQFRVRSLDLSSEDLEGEGSAALMDAITREPPSDRGEVFRLERGRRYRQTFFRLEWDDTTPRAFKQGGVYLIVGGSGVVGQIITRNLIAKYQARVVWLGRSAPDSDKVREGLRAFAGHGDRLGYLQADALDEASLRRAVARIKQTHGEINGAIFSGMVVGTDNSIDRTTEAEFRSILAVKTQGSQAFYAALRDEPLDFMCFFSSASTYSFSGAAKLAAYAAGITFSDSFVRSLRAVSRFPVGAINWGAWKTAIGKQIDKLDDAARKHLGVLEDQEGFECFEKFVGELQQGRAHQLLCMRPSPAVAPLINGSGNQYVALTGGDSAAAVALTEDSIEIPHRKIADLKIAHAERGWNQWFARLMFCQMDALVEAAGIGMPQSVSELRRRCGVIDKYARWWHQSLDLLAADGYIAFDGDIVHRWDAPDRADTWEGWRAQKEGYLRNPDTKALAVLIDDCLRALPDILLGKILATDIVFPNSSMEKVGDLYKNNAVADTFNEIVATAVATYVRERLREDPQARLRILEVGAGTGGTSAMVFSALAPYRDSVREYCYTDLSKAFFFHAEENYKPDNPYLVCRRLDIEQPVEAQGINIGSYDLVIATNVLHATKNIRNTLRHAKAALRKNGLIVINEMAYRSLSTHLTFALLDGWWLFEDAELRIPGCPGLYPESWRRVLQEEGFPSVLLPGSEAQPLGSQVIVARSDGVIRLEESAPDNGIREEEEGGSVEVPGIGKPEAGIAPPPGDLPAYVRSGLLECLSATLRIDTSSIEPDMAFSDYGVDSILGVNLIDRINERLGILLNTAVLFEYSSAESLSAHIVEAYGDRIRAIPSTGTGVLPERPQSGAPPQMGQRQNLPTHVRNSLLECLSSTLRIEANDIEPDMAFSDYGVDSILGVNLIERINERLGISLNTAVLFEYATAESLGTHIIEAWGETIQPPTVAVSAVSAGRPAETAAVADAVASPQSIPRLLPAARPGASSPASPEIAIVGMSGKFPKADNVEQFWQNLIDGVDGVDELPPNYLDQASGYSAVKQKGKTRCKWGGVLEDRDCFDPLFFRISPKEAEAMNPHQRLVMQEGWNAMEDAGYNPKALSGSQTGVFIGAEPAQYVGDTFTGLSDAIVASRLSYALNFNGPALVVNTGCSSSAVAIHLACESLRSGESDFALAGGVNACIYQDILVRLDQIEMLSPSGRCFTFDKAGDGTILSEGVGILALKRLDDAVAAGDHIYASICASGANQDGSSNGITAPSGAAQEKLITGVYDRFGIDPEQISYIEAHGTGTSLGDPVETNALVRAFRRYSTRAGWCAIGSAKSHIGHAAAAAGAIGVIKVLLSMRHRQFPKLLHFNEMNPMIEFEGSPFYVTSESSPWLSAPDVPRMAALNSFGHSGTNVHLVFKEYLSPVGHRGAPAARSGGEVAIPLSARTPEQLRQRCEDLLRFIRSVEEPLDLEAVAYTLQVGREPMEERLGFVVDSVDALAERLSAHLAGRDTAGTFRGQAQRDAGPLSPTGSEPAARLLEHWVGGGTVDWNPVWIGRPLPGRTRLPGYPFAKEHYWAESALRGRGDAAAEARIESLNGGMMEDIINRIVDDSLEAGEGAQLLRNVL